MGNVIVWIVVASAILSLVAGWKMLKKAGENPWKILIPIYGVYHLYRIASAEGVYWGGIAVSVVSAFIYRTMASNIMKDPFVLEPDFTPLRTIPLVAGIIILLLQIFFVIKLAESFGKGNGFAAGLFFLFPIFALILGFGSAQYGSGSGYDKIASSNETWKCEQCGENNPQFRGTCQKCGAQK